MKLSFKKLQSGFTFVELLIALSLFAVGMLGVLQVFPVNRRFLVQSANATQASFLAQEGMETVRSLPYGSVASQAATNVSTTAGDPLSLYTRQVTVSTLDGAYQVSASDIGLKRVSVVVTWPERSGTRSYTISTIISEH